MMYRVFSTFIVCLVAGTCIAQSSLLKTGQHAPEISMPRIDGQPFTLNALKGRLILIDFWASWCAPCVKEQPLLKELYKKFAASVKENKFEMVGVSLDKDKRTWEKMVARLKINWIQVSDLKFWKSAAAKDYGIEALPFNVVLNEQNQVIAINLHGKELEAFIQQHLEPRPPE
ncbi:TlpA family protein disulfide reductase [Niabella sp. CC-SYL272]|uniref:TlpA family protein disulfide reductase n=1 Tax=Niabella agricola TaxID=2891571 RepID=UPI001F2DB529|nr:TlpA disulfide reductase family protein [Niabella agricola]MCF3107594.1 TlpA family protein disulfide reductase [Niabella agricola]